MKILPSIKDAFIFIENDIIADYGRMEDCKIKNSYNPYENENTCKHAILNPEF